MLVDFGWADYSIPLGILDWYEARWFGLSEIVLRAPMLACGLATLVVLPLYVAPRVGRATASVFALLIAISPLLVIYSRMARPYAITLLLGWIAHAAYVRYDALAPRAGRVAGLVYGTAATLAIWLHPIIAPFVLAPLLWGAAQLLHTVVLRDRRQRLLRLVWIALATCLAHRASLVLPPVLAHPESLTGQERRRRARPRDAVRACGTRGWERGRLPRSSSASRWPPYGARDVWRALPEARTGSLGIALTLLGVMLTRPAWSCTTRQRSRAICCRSSRCCCSPWPTARSRPHAAFATPSAGARRALRSGWRRCPAPRWRSSRRFRPMLRYPSTQTAGLVYYMDFRPAKNPFLPVHRRHPAVAVLAQPCRAPAGSLRIAAAPFYFESYNWDAARWERVSRQSVLPGYLTGLCVDQRAGEVPQSPMFRLPQCGTSRRRRSLAQAQD